MSDNHAFLIGQLDALSRRVEPEVQNGIGVMVYAAILLANEDTSPASKEAICAKIEQIGAAIAELVRETDAYDDQIDRIGTSAAAGDRALDELRRINDQDEGRAPGLSRDDT